MSAPLLEIENLSKDFLLKGGSVFEKKVTLKAVRNVSLSIAKGETLGLVGESGSGKSTLGHVVMNLLKPTSGKVRFDGAEIEQFTPQELKPFRRRMQLIFQDPYSSLNPTHSVGTMLGEVLSVHKMVSDRAGRDARIKELLDLVGLPASAANRYPHEFSGGQRQRIVIARAIATNPEFIVADEPVSALDVSIQAQIVQLIEELKKELGLTLLLIGHDLGLVQYMSDRVGVLYLGRLVEIAPTRQIFSNPRHPYTEMLLSAVPSVDGSADAKRILPQGEIPSPLSPPSGCVFRTRCRYAKNICASKIPELKQIDGGHYSACLRDDILRGATHG